MADNAKSRQLAYFPFPFGSSKHTRFDNSSARPATGCFREREIFDESAELTALPRLRQRTLPKKKRRIRMLGTRTQKEVPNIHQTEATNSMDHMPRTNSRSPSDERRPQHRNGSLASRIPNLARKASKLGRLTPSPTPERQTRWDEYLGEPTRSATGKPGQVRPSAYNDNPVDDNNYKVEIFAEPEKARKPSWSERAVKLGRDAFNMAGNGRAAPVSPVAEAPEGKYTAFKTAPTVGSPVDIDSDSDTSLGSSAERSHKANDSQAVFLAPVRCGSVSPMLPSEYLQDLGDADVSPLSTHGRSIFSESNHNSSTTLNHGSSVRTIHRKPLGSSSLRVDKENGAPPSSGQSTPLSHANMAKHTPTSHMSWSTTADTDIDAMSVNSGKTLQAGDDGEPTSRFSWTTVNTATTYQQESPPASPPTATLPPLDSKIWKRAHAESGSHVQQRTTSNRDTETSDNGKSLPQPPTISKTMNHVDALAAQRDDLAVQHRNIKRVIQELQRVEIASPLEVDMKSRRENQKRLDEYTARLEDIERQEHEIGRAVARARRKAEREEGIDSGLWVRRVTG